MPLNPEHGWDVDHKCLGDGGLLYVGAGVRCAEGGRGRDGDGQATRDGIFAGRALHGEGAVTGLAQRHVEDRRR